MYLIYGMYHCLNLVTEPEEAILAGPRIGIDCAQEARDFPWRFTLGEKTRTRSK